MPSVFGVRVCHHRNVCTRTCVCMQEGTHNPPANANTPLTPTPHIPVSASGNGVTAPKESVSQRHTSTWLVRPPPWILRGTIRQCCTAHQLNRPMHPLTTCGVRARAQAHKHRVRMRKRTCRRRIGSCCPPWQRPCRCGRQLCQLSWLVSARRTPTLGW